MSDLFFITREYYKELAQKHAPELLLRPMTKQERFDAYRALEKMAANDRAAQFPAPENNLEPDCLVKEKRTGKISQVSSVLQNGRVSLLGVKGNFSPHRFERLNYTLPGTHISK